MTDTASIVIIGGGVVGASIAYFLAQRGAGRDVLVLERDAIASGSTARAVGGIRSQYSTEINVTMSIESVRFWRQAADVFDTDIGYRETGYLFLAQTLTEAEEFSRNVALQNALGVSSQLMSPQDAAHLVPGLNVSDLTAAAYCAEDAMANPVDATNAFVRLAREGGVRFREGVEVTGINVKSGRVKSVETSQGRVDTPLVVNAAGPWAGVVGRLAGVDVPVLPYRREIFVSEAFPRSIIGEVPLVIDLHTGWYFRREGEGVLMAGAKDALSSFDTHVNWETFPEVAAVAAHRMPPLQHATFGRKAWAGSYDISPDNHAILGEAPGVKGFYLACGFSGHGFQHSPATGRILADLLTSGTAPEVETLGLERFQAGNLIRDTLSASVPSSVETP